MSTDYAGTSADFRAQVSDRDAFGRLYGQHVDGVFPFVGSRVRDCSLAEDLTSETFLRALRRIDSGGCQVRNAGAWFTTIARNLVLDHARCSRRRPERATARIVDFPTVEA